MTNFKLIKVVTVVLCLALVAAIWLTPSLAFAQDGSPIEDPSGVSEILLLVLKLVFSALGIVGTWLTTKAIGYFEKKTGIDVPAATEELIHKWADKGIGLAFEKSHQAVKNAGNKLSGPEKMDIAFKFVAELIRDNKLPERAEEKLKEYIEARLGLMRKDEGSTVPDTIEAVEETSK